MVSRFGSRGGSVGGRLGGGGVVGRGRSASRFVGGLGSRGFDGRFGAVRHRRFGSRRLGHRDPGGRRLVGRSGPLGRGSAGRGQRRRRAGNLAQIAEGVLVDLHAQGQALPERDHLRRRRLPTPGREQEPLGQGPQIDRVGLAPGHGVAGQHERAALGDQVVGAEAGYARIGGVEGPDLFPAARRVEELGGHAAERVGGAGDVVGPYRHDLRRLAHGGDPGLAGHRRHGVIGAGRHGARAHRGCRGCGARRGGRQGEAAVGFGRTARDRPARNARRLARHPRAARLGAARDPGRLGAAGLGAAGGFDPLHVDDGLGEQRGALAVPGLLGVVLGLLLAFPGLPPLARVLLVRGRLSAGLARTGLMALHAVGDRGGEQRQGADPGQDQDQEDEVEGEPSRQRPVVDEGLGVGPLGGQFEPGRAQHHKYDNGQADHDESGEHIGEQTPVRGLAVSR